MARGASTYRGERRLLARAQAEASRWRGERKKSRDIWPSHTLDCQNQPDPGLKKTEKRAGLSFKAMLGAIANATVGRRTGRIAGPV